MIDLFCRTSPNDHKMGNIALVNPAPAAAFDEPARKVPLGQDTQTVKQ
ncbi:hypothetical protein LSG25_02855 [Paralcaligenes sp. KSB-10]|nr:hypothetical protein [Paralcaligenes sp. KSB-10]UHL64861.1 hypothetical protein LSG25_02855 [Paralcaligenes sp. KSB-10]